MPTSAASGEDHLNRGLARASTGLAGGAVRTAAVSIVAEVYHCSDKRSRELLAAMSQCHHL